MRKDMEKFQKIEDRSMIRRFAGTPKNKKRRRRRKNSSGMPYYLENRKKKVKK